MTRAQRLVAALALAGCADGGTETGLGPERPQTPPPRLAGGLRGVVDVAAGTLTFEAPGTAGTLGRDPRSVQPGGIYGDQGVTVRLYNSPVTVGASPTPGKETYTANVGVQNLLAFPIGDEQAGPAPADTMGIYVFITAGPTVTGTSSPCSPACSVTARNHHGTLAFDDAAQHYWHWDERLGPAGGGDDTTRARRAWVFEADTQVTSFAFEVLVSAGWAPPNDLRWKLEYPGDSVPNLGAEPRWTHSPFGTPPTFSLSNPPGILTIVTLPGARLTMFQTDSLGPTSQAYMEARVRLNLTTLGPEISFGIDDQQRFIAVGISGTRVGFMTGTGSFTFLPGSVATTTTTFRTYQLRKFGADSVQIRVDGVRALSRAYTTLPTRLAGSGHGFYFGPLGTGSGAVSQLGNSSSWDYIIYEIGATEP